MSRLPVHRNSSAYIATIGTDRGVHADFGPGLWEGGPIGIPVTRVPAGQAGVKVSFEFADGSVLATQVQCGCLKAAETGPRLGGLKGTDFEAVDTSGLMVSPDSAACRFA